MAKPLLISVITPSLNSAGTLQRAIESVLAQDYPAFEHIIVDGGSRDGTIELLKRYDHLKWISEPDHGQSDAMNKGFAMSSGDVIVVLNCDDYFAGGAFNAVVPLFEQGSMFVVGNVEVKSYRLGHSFVNRPRIGLKAIMRHWENDAYCYNPVGYFYRREVQASCPFNATNQTTMDVEFLLCAASRFPMTRIDRILGHYDEGASSKTTKSQGLEDYWSARTFGYVDGYLGRLSEAERQEFLRDRRKGYARAQRFWQRQQKRIALREMFSRFRKRFGRA